MDIAGRHREPLLLWLVCKRKTRAMYLNVHNDITPEARECVGAMINQTLAEIGRAHV